MTAIKINYLLTGLLLATGLFLSSVANASSEERIAERLKEQKITISKGIKLGQITKSEKKSLNYELSAIHTRMDNMLKDDEISSKEEKKLNKMLDDLGVQIFKLRYNNKRKK